MLPIGVSRYEPASRQTMGWDDRFWIPGSMGPQAPGPWPHLAIPVCLRSLLALPKYKALSVGRSFGRSCGSSCSCSAPRAAPAAMAAAPAAPAARGKAPSSDVLSPLLLLSLTWQSEVGGQNQLHGRHGTPMPLPFPSWSPQPFILHNSLDKGDNGHLQQMCSDIQGSEKAESS